jgi:protein-disulfide isomerase
VQQPLPPLKAIAKQTGFTEKSFEECLANQKLLDDIQKVRQRAVDKFQVRSTPTFFINGTKHPGALTIEDISKAIDAQLKG